MGTTTSTGSWFTEAPSTQLLEMHGREGIDLLERISTNELTKMEMGTWRQTILTNEKGRMIDVVWVGRRSADVVLILPEAHSGQKSQEWIEKFIIMEDVRIAPPGIRFRHFTIIGETNAPMDTGSIEWEQQWGELKMQHVLIPETARNKMLGLLEGSGLKKKSAEEFEAFRIAAGMPLGNEINENFNPLEAGLGHLISWTKGCYVGQEVIARLDSYKKVQRHLVPLELSKDVGTVPLTLKSTGGDVGTLTSATIHAPFDGLGYLTTRYLETRGQLFVEGEDGRVEVKVKG